MIKCLLFSKDRAMQVHASLQSFFAHCAGAVNICITVLYTCSNEQHSSQYLQLALEWQSHPQVKFIKQSRFRQDVFKILNPYASSSLQNFIFKFLTHTNPRFLRLIWPIVSVPYTSSLLLFLVDDVIFTHEFLLSEITECLEMHKDALGFSLRLGKNTTYCYTNNCEQQLPFFQPLDANIQRYNWVNADQDFGYPLEVSSSVYRLFELLPILLGINFNNPNFLESGMSACKNRFASTSPFLLCFNQSVAFCNPINLVQTACPQNRVGTKTHYSSNELANLFDAGNRIKFEVYHHITSSSCHQEMDLVFEKRAKPS